MDWRKDPARVIKIFLDASRRQKGCSFVIMRACNKQKEREWHERGVSERLMAGVITNKLPPNCTSHPRLLRELRLLFPLALCAYPRLSAELGDNFWRRRSAAAEERITFNFYYPCSVCWNISFVSAFARWEMRWKKDGYHNVHIRIYMVFFLFSLSAVRLVGRFFICLVCKWMRVNFSPAASLRRPPRAGDEWEAAALRKINCKFLSLLIVSRAPEKSFGRWISAVRFSFSLTMARGRGTRVSVSWEWGFNNTWAQP